MKNRQSIYESKEILRNTYTVQGTVAYETQIILRAPYPLTVVSVQKRVGETVKRGDALFTFCWKTYSSHCSWHRKTLSCVSSR